MRALILLVSFSAAYLLLPAGTSAAQPHRDGEVCGQVTVFGKPEVVSAFPTPCSEAMEVANKMIALWPAGSRFVKFDGWSCAGVTGGEASMGDWWDLDCENAETGGKVVFSPPGT